MMDDVLERARRDVIYNRSDRPSLCALIDDLAAEVRALRKDRDRLEDELLQYRVKECVKEAIDDANRTIAEMNAALSARGGEGEK